MSWQTVTVRIPDEELKEAIVGEFSADPIAGVWEKSDGAVSEVVLYFETGRVPPLVESRIRLTFRRNGFPEPEIRMGEEGPADWTLRWRRGFGSFPVGRRFRVVPSWEEPPEGDSRIALRIDPGMAFGTGTHESTRMAVELIEGVRLAEPILDLGTGSGILAIAASRLGAKRVMASDLDRDAVRVAQANFRKNRVEVPVFEGSTDAVRTSSIGLLLGNLTAEVIESRLGEFARILVPGGTVVLSGILASQAGALEAALAASGFRVDRRIEGGEWVAYVASRAGRRGD